MRTNKEKIIDCAKIIPLTWSYYQFMRTSYGWCGCSESVLVILIKKALISKEKVIDSKNKFMILLNI
ncbi:hypothetical protein GCM10007199_08550 [Fictibacillus barbaricus]|nr:hypothetical protein GCM10007199_08550 [Fictibacillus barbaricus]